MLLDLPTITQWQGQVRHPPAPLHSVNDAQMWLL